MNALLKQFQALPRAGQWLIFLGVFLLAFFALIRPLMSYGDAIGNSAGAIETAITRRKDLASTTGDGGYIVASQNAFGSPIMPTSSSAGLKPEAFTRVVNAVLYNHGVTESNISERKVRMPQEQSSTLGLSALDRLIVEVSFEAEPDTVIAILAEFERSPEVAAVSRVKIDRASVHGEDDRLVRATISPEAWIATGGGGGGGAPSSSSEVLQ